MLPNVSVIIAAYNEEKNIAKCIDSLINQQYENIEVIIVDDGSTDGTANILSKYSTFNNVKVISIENAGVSNARNIGLQHVTGSWIMFADADDYYNSGAILALVTTAEKTKCKVVQGGLRRGQEIEKINSHEFVHIFDSKVVAKVLLDYDAHISDEYKMYDRHMRLSTHGPYGKIFSKEIITDNNISFDTDMGLGEDLLFYFKVLNSVDQIAIYENDVYVVQENPHSSTRKFNIKMPEYAVTFSNRIIEYMKSSGIHEDYKNNIHYQIYMHIMVGIKCCYLHVDNNQNDYVKAKELRKFIEFSVFQEAIEQNNKISTNWLSYSKLMIWLLAKKSTYLYVKLFKLRKWIREGIKK
ncbi:glycosyltransferase family 2 protein [Paenibacillus sp. PL2-23]|uniref:glycosyltransferase family 2 protein n=1 Tax=Paenibacillus sp. PL2-23 TaxID=2100729 RepID=UPI0030F8A92F